MRTQKFKFWDKNLKKMRCKMWGINDLNHPDIIPLEFIGRQEKNGKDVYNGDILSEPVEVDGKMADSIEPVFYHEGEAAYCVDNSYKKDRSHYYLLRDCDLSKMSVIGNVYENPEMLNLKQ